MVSQKVFLGMALLGLLGVAAAGYAARGGGVGEELSYLWSTIGDRGIDGLLALEAGRITGLRYFLGALVGGLAGFALYHAAFGFTGAWRRVTRERRGRGLRAMILLIGLTSTVTYLMIGFEKELGWNMHPVIIGMGLSSAIGALMFGIGMQLGGGCASGTLFTAGGGSAKMILVLAFFILGSVLGTKHMNEFWLKLPEITGIPNIRGISLINEFGTLPAIALILAFCALVMIGSRIIEYRANGDIEKVAPTESLLYGRWSLRTAAIALALVGVLSFLLFHRPWGVTAGFALWGAKVFTAIGIDVMQWGYWQGWRKGMLGDSVFANRTSLMNFGILFGAMAAAALAGRFKPMLRLSRTDLLTAVIGGLMMGYGARLSFGCNIGALLGGIVSGSMHGFWWLLWGFLGSVIGTRIRGRIGMDPPLPARPAPA